MKSITHHFISLSIFLAIMFIATTVLAQEEQNLDEPVSSEVNQRPTDTTEEEARRRAQQATSEPSTGPERREAIEAIQQEVTERREAVRDAATERREEVRDAVTERREEIRENVETRRAALEERAQTRIINLAANLSNRLDAVVDRLQNITNRINARIVKLGDAGLDTTTAQAELAVAQAAIDSARRTLATIDTVVVTSVTSESPRTAWQSTKATFIAIREDVRTAHAALRATVSALKDAVRTGNNPTTPEDEESITSE